MNVMFMKFTKTSETVLK